MTRPVDTLELQFATSLIISILSDMVWIKLFFGIMASLTLLVIFLNENK